MFRFWLSRVLHYLASKVEGNDGWSDAYSRLNFADGPQVYVWKFRMDKIKDTDSYWITEVKEGGYVIQAHPPDYADRDHGWDWYEQRVRIKHVQDASELTPYLDEDLYYIHRENIPLRATDWMTSDEALEEIMHMYRLAFRNPNNVVAGKPYTEQDEVSV